MRGENEGKYCEVNLLAQKYDELKVNVGNRQSCCRRGSDVCMKAKFV